MYSIYINNDILNLYISLHIQNFIRYGVVEFRLNMTGKWVNTIISVGHYRLKYTDHFNGKQC